MNAHTKTPWSIVHDTQIYGLDEENVATANRMQGRDNQVANAAFIVRACNSHDALVAALEDIRDIIADQTYPTHAMKISDISAAVERAGLKEAK